MEEGTVGSEPSFRYSSRCPISLYPTIEYYFRFKFGCTAQGEGAESWRRGGVGGGRAGQNILYNNSGKEARYWIVNFQDSLLRWPIFRPHNSKPPKKKVREQEKFGLHEDNMWKKVEKNYSFPMYG
jgi:hypothetical protein